jgi:hypothetical protein
MCVYIYIYILHAFIVSTSPDIHHSYSSHQQIISDSKKIKRNSRIFAKGIRRETGGWKGKFRVESVRDGGNKMQGMSR